MRFIDWCPTAYVLSLDHRWPLWSELVDDLDYYGFDARTFICGGGNYNLQYDKIDDHNPDVRQWGYGKNIESKQRHKKALEAHKSIIQEVKGRKLPRFLMMEDDTYLIKSRWPLLPRLAINSLSSNNIEPDLLYLSYWVGERNGWYQKVEEDYKNRGNTGLLKVTNSSIGGLHAVIVNHTMYNFLLSLPNTNPIDRQLNLIGHNNRQSWILTPKVAHINSTYSYCEQSFIEREILK